MMADKTNTSFSKVGEGIPKTVVNRSGAPSPKTTPVPKTGNSKGGAIENATAKHRSGKLEKLGAKYAPQAKLYKPNAAESSATERNVRLMPSAVGNRDFWDKRKQYKQTGDFG
jgi:hypothetical protein